jgi:hypothetical protein
MKLNGSLLLVAALAVSSFGAMGCNKSDHDKGQPITDKGNNAAPTEASTPSPEDNPDVAPVSEEKASAHDSPAMVEKDAQFVTYWAYRAPPALRVETVGVAPHPGWAWRPGYWGWGGRDYAWYGGRWYAPRVGYSYYGPSWYRYGTRWGYRPGRWYR